MTWSQVANITGPAGSAPADVTTGTVDGTAEAIPIVICTAVAYAALTPATDTIYYIRG